MTAKECVKVAEHNVERGNVYASNCAPSGTEKVMTIYWSEKWEAHYVQIGKGRLYYLGDYNLNCMFFLISGPTNRPQRWENLGTKTC